MALSKFKASPIPKPPMFIEHGTREYLQQAIRVIELYFTQLDSKTPNNAESYTADNFYGGVFTGDGSGLDFDEGRFASSEDQVATDIADANLITFNVTSLASGIAVVDSTKFTPTVSGIYLFACALEFQSDATGTELIDVWSRKDGANRANSNFQFSIPARKTPSILATKLASFSTLISVTAGEYIEFVWRPSDLSVTLVALPAVTADATTPDIPAGRSAKMRVVFVSALEGDL